MSKWISWRQSRANKTHVSSAPWAGCAVREKGGEEESRREAGQGPGLQAGRSRSSGQGASWGILLGPLGSPLTRLPFHVS